MGSIPKKANSSSGSPHLQHREESGSPYLQHREESGSPHLQHREESGSLHLQHREVSGSPHLKHREESGSPHLQHREEHLKKLASEGTQHAGETLPNHVPFHPRVSFPATDSEYLSKMMSEVNDDGKYVFSKSVGAKFVPWKNSDPVYADIADDVTGDKLDCMIKDEAKYAPLNDKWKMPPRLSDQMPGSQPLDPNLPPLKLDTYLVDSESKQIGKLSATNAENDEYLETPDEIDMDDAAQVRMYDLLRRLESYMGDLDVNSLGDDEAFWGEIPDWGEMPNLNPRRTSAWPNYPHGQEVKEECLICFDHGHLRKRLCCDFPVCDTCMERYLETEVGQGNVKIPCISGTCSAFVFRDEILGRLPNSLKDKYYRFLVDANKDPNIKTCPRCSNIYNVEEKGCNDMGKFGVLVTCPECQMDWCFDCHAPWHETIKCKDFRKGNKLLKTWAKEQHFGHHNAQRCPNCKIFIERKGGCDHMVCSRCNTSFCYRCGDRFCDLKFFGNHLSRFSPLGCKYNFKPDQPFVRRTVRGTVFGAKLLGGLALLGLGVAAAGVLLGASVIILPVFGGYKYHKHRKMKRRIKHQQALFKMRTKNAMMEMYKERERLGLDMYDKFARGSLANENNDTVHIGIQTGQSQQVDVTVHNPYHTDTLPPSEQSHEIRMNITDDRGKVTVTTAEITHNATSGDGSEAEIVLHVKTTYSKSDENEVQNAENLKIENGSERNKAECSGDGANPENDPKSNSSESGRSRASSFSNRSNSLKNSSPKSSRRSKNPKKWDTGSLKSGSKKSENGSLSKKNKKAVAPKVSETVSQNAVTLPDLGQGESLTKSEESEHSSNTDQHSETESLSQSGCLLKLFSKKLNTLALQNQIEKEKVKQTATRVNTDVKDISLSECPDIVTCTLESEVNRIDSVRDETEHEVTDMDKYLGFVSMETHTTPL